MKILLINPTGQDYLTCMIIHGLVTLGYDVTEYNYTYFMREQYRDKFDIWKLYGNGFSYAFTLHDIDKNITKEEIETKVSEHYYDIVIYTYIQADKSLLDLVLEKYKLGEIFIIDGADHSVYDDIINKNYNNILYFKRELLCNNSLFGMNCRVFPISYAIPKEKFQPKKYYKTNFCVNNCSYGVGYTGIKTKYTFDNEQEYYNQYNNSAFALTCRKGGYDCMRHYEIIACHCLPVFIDYDNWPRTVMTTWPTDLQYQANSLYIEHKYNDVSFNNDYQVAKYYKLLDRFYDYAYTHMTTENLANYLLSFC